MSALAMASLRELIPEVIRTVRGAPDPHILAEARNAAREFCRSTTAWRWDMPALNTLANEGSYKLLYPAGTVPHRAIAGRYLDPGDTVPRPIHPRNRDQLAQSGLGDYTRFFPGFGAGAAWESLAGPPRYYLHPEETTVVRLVPVPDTDGPAALRLHLSLLPARDASAVPDWLLDSYYEALAAGTRRNLLMLPDFSWTDLTQAAIEERNFQDRIGKAQADVFKSHSPSPLAVTPVIALDR